MLEDDIDGEYEDLLRSVESKPKGIEQTGDDAIADEDEYDRMHGAGAYQQRSLRNQSFVHSYCHIIC